MSGRLTEVGVVTALATLVTGFLAMPVLRAPTERVFGAEIVGRHHDPFTVMQLFERRLNSGPYAQPITDVAGALIAQVSGGVAAYNLVVLVSFPLAAAAAYLLARHLALSRPIAAMAGMAFAFSPFHLAHAAYHPHVAQVQWLPLYFLALWRCLDTATPAAVVALSAATLAVTLSNFYGGLIAAVLTPVAVAAYWLSTRQAGAHPLRRLGVTVASLLILSAAGVGYAWWTASVVIVNPAPFAFAPQDLVRYSATWASYLVPPVEHPLLGPAAAQYWSAAGVSMGLLEQQLSLGWGVIALALIALVQWLVTAGPAAPLARVPVLVVIAIAAMICSLSPGTIGTLTVAGPSALLYELMPMFRSYARFGSVVQLMAVLLAGIAVESLLRSRTRRGRAVGLALVALAVTEYAVLPARLWRDVLPTAAHRWVVQQPGAVQALDCSPPTPDAASVPWLSGARIALASGGFADCAEPNLADKLSAAGFTHLLMRPGTAEARAVGRSPLPAGLQLAARFPDAEVLSVTAPAPVVYTEYMAGFSPREADATWTWRWMGTTAYWRVVNRSARPVLAAVDVEMASFPAVRHVTLLLDGTPVQTAVINVQRGITTIGPLALTPGDHDLVFEPREPPIVAADVLSNGDRRALSLAVGTWRWTAREARP